MWQVTLVSVIVAFIGFLFYGYLRTKSADIEAKQDKIDALERAAEEDREREHAADEREAQEIIASGDNSRAIGFLRGSFKTGNKVQTP